MLHYSTFVLVIALDGSLVSEDGSGRSRVGRRVGRRLVGVASGVSSAILPRGYTLVRFPAEIESRRPINQPLAYLHIKACATEEFFPPRKRHQPNYEPQHGTFRTEAKGA
jgi:hypothetical protein